jgi:hypothetical protein
MPGVISRGSPRLASVSAAVSRCLPLNPSRAASALARRSAFDRSVGKAAIQDRFSLSSPSKISHFQRLRCIRRNAAGYWMPPFRGYDEPERKCEAADAVGALDPGVPYESRWAPYVRIHGPGQGQFPKGSIRPRGYMAPDARRSLAKDNVAAMLSKRQRHSVTAPRRQNSLFTLPWRGRVDDEHPLNYSIVKQPSVRALAARFARVMPKITLEKRAQGMPGAWPHPQPCVQRVKAHKLEVTTGRPKHSGIPCAMVLRFPSGSPR